MFDVCVDAVIREWLWRTVDKEAANGIFAEASREIVAFLLTTGWSDQETPFGCRVPLTFS
jgi:hypothetical protein